MAHYEIDEVKWRVAEMLGGRFSFYSEDEIVEVETAFRTDDPEELQQHAVMCLDVPNSSS